MLLHTRHYVPIIRRNNCVYATLDPCYSVWMTVWYVGAYASAYQTLRAHHQEKQLCFCDTWYLLFCVDDCLVCRSICFCIPDTTCPSSGETTVFLRHLVLAILCGWLSGIHQVGFYLQDYFFDIYFIMSPRILLQVSTRKGTSPGNQTKAISHKTKLATFVHNCRGVEESNI